MFTHHDRIQLPICEPGDRKRPVEPAIGLVAEGPKQEHDGSQIPEDRRELLSYTKPTRDLDAQDTWQFEIRTRGVRGEHVRWDVAFFDAEGPANFDRRPSATPPRALFV